ncbi:MAG: hypothetical protein ACYS3N_10490 [Planctomycetota bacterium]|jgi:hypothetical protein
MFHISLLVILGNLEKFILLRTAAISTSGVVRPKFILEEAIGYACGDFDLPSKPEKISLVLVTKAIFRGSLSMILSIWPVTD